MRFADRLRAFFGLGGGLGQDFFDELADLLVEGDLGAALSFSVAEELEKRCRREGIKDPGAARAELAAILAGIGKESRVELGEGGLDVFLLLGVNGVGKTTSCARLARHFQRTAPGAGIVLAAGDTFRAGAIEQLKIHGQRLGLRVVAQRQGSDPGAVIFDALDAARSEGARVLIADSAGRMHTRQDLMRELEKIDRVVAAKASEARYRRLLVLDATTGQNALRQAEIFGGAVPIEGLILTKYDSSAKGGIVLALAKERGLPTAFLGTGEGYEDFRPFSLEAFLADFVGTSAAAANAART